MPAIMQTLLPEHFFLDPFPEPRKIRPAMKKIENADNYVLTESGMVYSLTSKRAVRKHWSPRSGREWCRITNNNGQRVSVYLDQLSATTAAEPPTDDMLPIAGFPEYRITSYGAVWRVTDRRNRRPTPIRITSRGQHEYVQMIDESGKRRTVNVAKLLESATLAANE